MEYFLISVLNGVAYGLLLFMLSSGLTLTFSMMGVVNFAHASFYMLGAYFAYSLSKAIGFWLALAIAPILVGIVGAAVERFGLRSLHKRGPIAELLVTFGLAYVVGEAVQIGWGQLPLPSTSPAALEGSLFTIYGTNFPVYRAFIMMVALVMMATVYLLLTRTRLGLIVQAALTHPEMVESLGHNVPRVFMLVFGLGCALAGLAGVMGGVAFVTEPSMAHTLGGVIFVVVVVGGLGSLVGALLASLLIGLVQTFAVGLDYSVAGVLRALGVHMGEQTFGYPVWTMTVSQIAPMLPYLFLVAFMIFRPRGLMGTREA